MIRRAASLEKERVHVNCADRFCRNILVKIVFYTYRHKPPAALQTGSVGLFSPKSKYIPTNRGRKQALGLVL
jgi:hypothetical protein